MPLLTAEREEKMKKISVLLLLLMICSILAAGCGKKETGVLKIASKPMTEQYILSEMLAVLIEEHTDLKVEITKGVGGGTTNIHPALLKGDFDLYPEYTGTAWITVLNHEEIPDDETMYASIKEEYDRLGLHWSGLYGFNNTYTLAVRNDLVSKYNLKTYSDLAAVSNELVFGGNYDYIEREDGYPLLCTTYGMNFKNTIDMDIALKYQAMEQQEIDVTNAFTTDAMLSTADVTTLEDDKQFFTNYYAGTVVRKETLEKYPELEEVLEKMTGILTDEDIQKLNYQVEGEEKDERELAVAFLNEKGLIEP